MPDKTPLVIAHRGARSLAPENTMAAARKAFELGADMWELDVSVTQDGELVLMHDDTLERTCNVKDVFPDREPWNVWDFTLEEIQSLDCGSWYNYKDPFKQIEKLNIPLDDQKSFKGEKAPSLREALEYTRDNQWRVNVEIKKAPTEAMARLSVEKTVALAEELGMDDGHQLVITSFEHEYLTWALELNPNIPVQAITSTTIRDLPEYLAELGASAVNPKINAWSYQKITEYEKQGIQFNVWTVNDEMIMKALINSGATGIITDYPQTLIEILKEE